ncbi:MAG: 4-hydroxy-tetrahydrodipicolinate synthase [Wolbachia endosymbiont of Fragariocoptes setiger]|nr:4-hydroxy-tetrahydrodipicolinate synthase [Wolbachia endosymbiont of Fragariocoptes setiger]
MTSDFLWTACVTPFNRNGNCIDYSSLKRLLIMQAEIGNGVILLGSTGESLSITKKEKCKLVKFVSELQLKLKIIIGVQGINLYQTLEWMNFCKDMLINGYLITTPIYTKPGVLGQTLWFEKILEKAHVPVMLYNIPSRTGVNLYYEVVYNLLNHENFWSIKDSSGSIQTLVEYKNIAPRIKVFCGDDNMIASASKMGASGLVSVASNVWPRITRKYVKKCLEGTEVLTDIWEKACQGLSVASNPIPIKTLLNKLGIITYKAVRLPLSNKDLSSAKVLERSNELMLKLNSYF